MSVSKARREDETVRAARGGDRAAMDRLIRRLSPRMERQLTSYGLDPQERADALQNALLNVVRGLDSFREESQVSTWAFRLTANEALMMLRSRRRRSGQLVADLVLEDLGSLPGMPAPLEPDAALCTARTAARVHREIERLPAHYRAVVVAHYLDELDLEEASRRLGVSTSALKGRLWRARSSMRASLEREERRAA